MSKLQSKEVLGQLFLDARSHHSWLPNQQITDQQIEELYDLMKWGPTAVNCGPARIVFIRTDEAKARLNPALMGSNGQQIRNAPLAAIVAYDIEFPKTLKTMWPMGGLGDLFSDLDYTKEVAFRNGTLQGAYMIIAARTLGLDVCPMSGFDNAAVDKEFFDGTSIMSNFLCTIGYGDHTKLFPRGPRLSFKDTCKIL